MAYHNHTISQYLTLPTTINHALSATNLLRFFQKHKTVSDYQWLLKVKLLSLELFPSPKASTHFPCRSTTCAAPASAPHCTSAATLCRSSSKGAAARPWASGVDRRKPQSNEPDDDDAGRFKVPIGGWWRMMAAGERWRKCLWFFSGVLG